MARVVCHFSCGAASAVATKLAIDKYGHDNLKIYNMFIREEHPDNKRFLKECQDWFNHPIDVIENRQYNGSIYEVFRQLNFIKSPWGAPCTTNLKRKVRQRIQRPNDIHIFGFTVEEQSRADDLEEYEPDLNFDWILIDQNVTKSDCLGFLQNANIEIPMMYKLGYKNNNCIGCVKGGMGYWNKIRVDFPDAFEKMAKLERERETLR